MWIYLFMGTVWVVVGLYGIQNNWRKNHDIKTGDLLMLFFSGIIIGPIMGLWDMSSLVVKKMFPKVAWGKVLIKKK